MNQKPGVIKGVINKAFNIKIECEEISSNYALQIEEISHATENGHLVIFKLMPPDNSQPIFLGRWDHVNETLDIDILGVGSKLRWRFNNGAEGFSGHHCPRIKQDPRTFQIDVVFRNEKVCRAAITMNVNWELNIPQVIRFGRE